MAFCVKTTDVTKAVENLNKSSNDKKKHPTILFSFLGDAPYLLSFR